MARVAPRWALIALLMIAAGCGGDPGPPPPPDSGPRDATPPGDAAIRDGGSIDGGRPDDAGPRADGGPTCVALGECDPFVPGGCGAAMGCRPGIGGTECGAVAASAGSEGAPCAGPTACEDGLLCIDFGDGQRCQRMCPRGSTGRCGAGLACTGSIGGDMCIRICRPVPEPCDIYAQDCADPADACTFARHPETDEAYTGCRPAGPRTRGEACGGDDGACAEGLVCISRDGVSRCHEVCREPGPPSCSDATESCTGLSATWMVSYCRTE